MKLSRELIVSRMKVIMYFDETELIKCNALTKISFNIIRGFLCIFSKRVREKSARKPEFPAEKPEKHPIHSTNQQSKTIVGFSYGGKHESNKRNKDPS